MWNHPIFEFQRFQSFRGNQPAAPASEGCFAMLWLPSLSEGVVGNPKPSLFRLNLLIWISRYHQIYDIYIYYIIYISHIYIIYIYQISRVILKAMTKFLETKIAASQWSAHLKCQKMCISASFYIQTCNEEHGWQVLKLNQIETSVIKALRFKRFGFVACHNAHQARDCMIQLPHDPHVSGWSRAMKYLYPEFPLQIITA